MTRSDRANLKIFESFCGDQNLSRIILATTRWDVCPSGTGDRREQELNDKFWNGLLTGTGGSNHASSFRLKNSSESAKELMKNIMLRILDAEKMKVTLNIQDQLINQAKLLVETDASIELRRKLKLQLQEARIMGNAKPERVSQLEQQTKNLKIPLGTKILRILGFVRHRFFVSCCYP